ncbi:DNA phosphorothioation-dependent restriction protein DptH [Marinococcus halophilus]|uniref:DNA phosphorothioation-dependent restriction protein DptH n=1 Tax=Marinococcus halophilus TaxID=1371 RepID=UPI0015C42493|nr:DNA phosphorothioation-dependent restriction protein DptH [Marinococcus halophilus]
MSNIFYEFMAEKIIDYLNITNVRPGDKYHVQFEKKEEVESLLHALCAKAKNRGLYNSFEWIDYKSFSLTFESCEVIVAGTNEGVTKDFLTKLRNMVGTNDDNFANKSIIFIHNTTLDSIVRGSVGFQDNGMPLSIELIHEYIKMELENSDLNHETKTVLEFKLENKEKKYQTNANSSIFEYEDILSTLDHNLTKNDYITLGLFFDNSIKESDQAEHIKKRLKDNQNFHQMIEESFNYGNPESDLDKEFDEPGLEKILKNDWKDITYQEIKKSHDNVNDIRPPVYIEKNLNETNEGLVFWDRPEGDTKAKYRKRHIIIFNDSNEPKVSMEFQFDKYLKKEFLTNSINNSAEVSGKRILMEHTYKNNEPNFLRFQYKADSATYDFKVVILPFSENFLANIKTEYEINVNKKEGSIKILSSNEDIVLNKDGENVIEVDPEKEDYIEASISDEIKINEAKEYVQNQGGEISLLIKIEDFKLPLNLVSEVPSLKNIDGINIYKLKREKERDFQFVSENRIVFGTQEFNILNKDLLKNLKLEYQFIQESALAIEVNNQTNISKEINVPKDLKEVYSNYLNYFKKRNTIPTLANWTNELLDLAEKYISVYKSLIMEINDGETLSPIQKELLYIGSVTVNDSIKFLKYSPLHPLNVMYQYSLINKIGEEEISAPILKRLDSKNLNPYIYFNNEIFKSVKQFHSPEWNYYQHYRNSRQNISTNFVPKLVKDKLVEFTKHYNFLFSINEQAPIKLNLVNLGDCKEVLQGLIEYYLTQIKHEVSLQDLLPIDLMIYGQIDSINAFEELSFYSKLEDVERDFDLKLKNSKYSEIEVLNAFRQKIHFYKKPLNIDKYEYAHITFYELDQTVDETSDQMNKIETGLTLEGMFSSLSSSFVGNSYRSGFGTKFIKNANELIQFSILLNSLSFASGKQNPYEYGKTIVTAFSGENENKLEKIYNASNWVTFVEPKFDLSFLNKNEDQNLLVLHYSDQYSPSNDYDAITVTKKTKEFQMLIEEFLSEHISTISNDMTKNVINLFNSLNGDWLLQMIGSKTEHPREKMSILSAVKFSLAFFAHKDITWIPLSLEEILRVSGAVGLSQKDGLFSAKNLGISGAQSDDILLVGIEHDLEKPTVHFYPIEVKIGRNRSDVLEKAEKQVKKTSETINEFLYEGNFKSAVYRDFLIHLTLVNAKKMKLYDIWPEYNWDKLLNEETRSHLLTDDYKISSANLKKHIGVGGVISFGKDIIFRKSNLNEDDILNVELPEKECYEFLVENENELYSQIHFSKGDISEDDILANVYKDESSNINEDKYFKNDKEKSYNDGGNKLVEQKNNKNEEKKPMNILFGESLNNRKSLYWYPTTTSKIMHTNTGIIGTMGTGKTQFTKSLVKQIHDNTDLNVNKTPIGILIFDYKGDYVKEDFVKATNAKIYDPYHLPFNPLTLYQGNSFKPLLPLHTANTIKETIANSFNLGVKQKQFLSDLILEAYESRGINKANKNTWKITAPTLHDVYRKFNEHEEAKEDSLYAALKQIDDFELFSPYNDETISLFDMIDGVTVINLAGYDPSIQNLIVGITLDSFYSQMLTKGHSVIDGDFREITKMILVDEADNFLSKDFQALKKIMKEGREFGVGTILSTQFMSHFATSDNDYSQYILTWIVHRVSELKKKEVQSVFNTESQKEIEQISNKIRSLNKHQSIVTSVSDNKYELMEDKAFWQLVNESLTNNKS